MLTQKVRISLFQLLRRKNTKNCGVKFPAIKGKQTKKKVGDQHLERFLKTIVRVRNYFVVTKTDWS